MVRTELAGGPEAVGEESGMQPFRLPFSKEAFLEVFRAYNEAIWPLHLLAYALGLVMVLAAVQRFRGSNQLVNGGLALLWMWVGAAYHLAHFRDINPAAAIFGALFILQGLLFLLIGVMRDGLHFRVRSTGQAVVGGLLILYAMVLYPLLGYLLGHVYPYAPMFGVAPCPLVIFTFGLLVLSSRGVPGYLLIIPVVWAVIGLSAATGLGMWQDLGLPAAALVTLAVLSRRRGRAG